MAGRNENLTGKADGERQHLVIGFSDLSGSTEITAAIEPEIYADMIAHLRDLFHEIIEKHGGEIIRIDGDGATYIFRHHQTQEDAGRRSVEAAIDLHAAVTNLSQGLALPGIVLRMHTGIHTGVVFVSPGNIEVGKHLIIGNATNTARRLCDLASADQIMVSDVTLGADIHFFRIDQKRTIKIRGSKQNLTVSAITSRKATSTKFAARISQGVAPFSGRQVELKRLAQTINTCAKSGPSQVFISGTMGIGKTRLLNEFIKQCVKNQISIHPGYCESYLNARPFQPIFQIVRSLLINEFGLPGDFDANSLEKFVTNFDAKISNSIMQLMSFTAPINDQSAIRNSDVLAAIISLLEKTSSDQPIVLCIDDWQLVDSGSRKVVDGLLAKITKPLLLVLVTRDFDELHASMHAGEHVTLEPLSANEAKTAVDGLLKTPGPFSADTIIKQANGNPLFLEELCHSFLNDDTGNTKNKTATTLESLVHSRFMRLPEKQAELIKTAAIIGNLIPAWLFEQITDVALGDPILTSLEDADFIYKSEVSRTLRFKHTIARDAIYKTVGLQRRQAIHNQIVEALHQRTAQTGEEEQLEALSYHYRAGGNAVRSIHYATRAGDRAMASSSLDRAQALFNSALKQIDALGVNADVNRQRKNLVQKYGLACVIDPSWDQLEILKQASNKAAATNDYESLASSEYWVGFILYGLGEAKQSIDHLESALRSARNVGDKKQIVQIRATLGQAMATACRYKPALALLDEAIKIKRNHRSGTNSSVGLSYSLSCKAFIIADQGEFDKSYEIFDEAIEVLQGHEHEITASVFTQRSACCLWQGNYLEAENLALQALKISERVRARYLYAMSQSLIGASQWYLHNQPKSLRAVIASTNWLESISNQQFVSLNYGWLAEFLEIVDDPEQSRVFAAKALRRAKKGDRMGEAMTFRALARAANKRQDFSEVKHYLEKAYQAGIRRNSPHELDKTQRCEAELLPG